jgi:hypothetical protein
MRCRHCNTRLAVHDVWCPKCQRQSSLVKNELSAMRSLKATWAQYKPNISINVPLAVPAIIFGIIPLLILIWLFNTSLMLPMDSTVKLLLNLLIKSVLVSLFLPFTLIGFKAVSTLDGYQAGKPGLFMALKAYPKYLVFSIINCAYFVVIYLICFGFPGFGSDPILRLVWIVLVNYWIALILPVPILMEDRNLSFMAAFKLARRHFGVVRWNIYLMVLVLAMLNILATLVLLVPLAITIPFSWYAVRDYTRTLLEYELDKQ